MKLATTTTSTRGSWIDGLTTATADTARRANTRFVALAQHLDVTNLKGRKFATNGEPLRLAWKRAHEHRQGREAVVLDPSGEPAAYIDTYEVPAS